MEIRDVLTILPVSIGCLFFLAGTAGLLRFPDVLSRLHALTKADNIGLGLIAAGLAVYNGTVFGTLKLVLVWLFLSYAGSLTSYLVAHAVVSHNDHKGKRT